MEGVERGGVWGGCGGVGCVEDVGKCVEGWQLWRMWGGVWKDVKKLGDTVTHVQIATLKLII